MSGSSSVSSSTLNALENLAARELTDAEIEREATALVEKLGEDERKRGGVYAAVSALEDFREALATAIAEHRPEGRLQSAYTYAANSIKPAILKMTEPKH